MTPGTPIKRNKLTPKQRAQMALDQDGMCGCADVPSVHPLYASFEPCGMKLDAREGITDEHLWPLAAGGSNHRSNRRLLRTPCAGRKTAHFDAGLIAEVKRKAGETGQQKRRAARKAAGISIWPKGRKIRSGGFSTTHTKRMDGTVIKRKGART